ncbi:MAG: multidrug effflux MFS transporter [Saprospiraceae bacterium]|nr:multidrug effflux MFS transporter [Saprospiraceae bacterium]MCB9322426.1 multidrug effflux MFS transporter [Lewinellaceae bacterium]
MKNQKPVEFIALMAFMMAIGAFSIDAILPAMQVIGDDFGITNTNDNQLLVSLVFLGLAIGQIFFGPLSDSLGRKPAVYFGFSIFIVGSLLSIISTSFEWMLFSRFIQGIGLGAPRTIGMAMVRDRYVGDFMARIMSFIMVVFILVPMVAPAVGQEVLHLAGWKAIYGTQILIAIVIVFWFYFRQEETLKPENKIPFSIRKINKAVAEIFRTKTTLAFTLIMGLIQGAFLVYLSSAQQIFQEQYNLGDKFPLVFALLALSIGVASLVNSKMVMIFGMDKMTFWSLAGFTVLSVIAAVLFTIFSHQNPPLWMFMVFLIALLFCTGILFGNLNALAMRPLGHVAGLGSTVVGFVSTLISVPLGISIGRYIEQTALPLVLGFAFSGLISMIIFLWLRGQKVPENYEVELAEARI